MIDRIIRGDPSSVAWRSVSTIFTRVRNLSASEDAVSGGGISFSAAAATEPTGESGGDGGSGADCRADGGTGWIGSLGAVDGGLIRRCDNGLSSSEPA